MFVDDVEEEAVGHLSRTFSLDSIGHPLAWKARYLGTVAAFASAFATKDLKYLNCAATFQDTLLPGETRLVQRFASTSVYRL